MEPIFKWSREYFLSNHQVCLNKLKSELTQEEKVELRSNLHFKEHGSLVLLSNFMVSDIREPEFYCDKYEVKQHDGSIRIETGKYADKLNVLENESCDSDPVNGLAERQVCVISESSSNNAWIKDHNSISVNSNKRKIENAPEEKSYLLKVYDSTEIKLNEFVEVVGFLYASQNFQTDDSMDEDSSVKLPAFCIHAVSFKELAHNNPIILQELEDSQQHSLDEIRQDLLKLFTQFLFGDELSANYLLFHMISCIYSRVNEEALGKFALNLITHSVPTDIMCEYARKLYNLMEVLLPNSMYFPLTIENLNTSDLVPKKDYTANKLSQGTLQLPKHTHLFLDETKLENGKLDNAGCIAVQHLTELIKSQQLQYDFQFYKLPFKTDFPVLLLSEGKSFLPSDFAVSIKPLDEDSVRLINENFAAGMHYMRPKLNAYRRYLTMCRLQQFDINEEEIKMIESDFVKMRESSSTFQVEHLHSLLVLSRLLGISKGLCRLNTDCWETAKRFELERINRMEKRSTLEP